MTLPAAMLPLTVGSGFSPIAIAGLVLAGALLITFVLILGGPRNDRPRR